MTQTERKTAGVMGGMGPDATVDFMARVIALTKADRDQDHVHMIVDQDPTIPNRQAAIASGRDDVSPRLAAMAGRLEAAGADFLVMVCNTAHVFVDQVRAQAGIPFISIIEETVAEIERRCPGARRIGVMATDGCLDTGIFQDAIEQGGRQALTPGPDDRNELMRLISAIKSGDRGASVARDMAGVATRLVGDGAGAIIGGCTEIPIVFEGADFAVPVISSTEVLAARTVALALGRAPLPEMNY